MTGTGEGLHAPRAPGWQPSLGVSLLLLVACQIPVLITLLDRGFCCDDWYFLLRAEEHDLVTSLRANLDQFGGLRPLGHVLMTIQYELFGFHPAMHQLWLALLHCLCTLSVFVFCRTLFLDRMAGLIGAALFAVIPWHMEVVYWTLCSMLQVSLCLTMLAGASFLRYAREPSAGCSNLMLCLISYSLAVLCYEQNLSWFFVWPFLASAADRRHGIRQILRLSWSPMTLGLVLGVLLALLSSSSQRQATPQFGLAHVGYWSFELLRRATIKDVYLTLVGLRSYHGPVLAFWLSAHPTRLISLALPCLSGILIAAQAVAAWRSRPQAPVSLKRILPVAAAMLVFPIVLLTLAPNPVIQPRLLHLTSPAVCVASVALLLTVPRRWPRSGVVLGLACAGIAVLLGAGSVIAATRSQQWVDGWQIQQQFSVALKRQLPEPEPNARFLVLGFPARVGNALAYENEYGLDNLVKWTFRRHDVHAVTGPPSQDPGMGFEADSMGVPATAMSPRYDVQVTAQEAAGRMKLLAVEIRRTGTAAGE